jgi:repressor of nif and glnA expression
MQTVHYRSKYNNRSGNSPHHRYPNYRLCEYRRRDIRQRRSESAKRQCREDDKVYKALEDLGIGKDKIKTVSYYINPRYDYTINTSVLNGYDVVNGIQVTVEDLAKVSQVLDMTVAQGVNQATLSPRYHPTKRTKRRTLRRLQKQSIMPREKPPHWPRPPLNRG